MVFMLHFKGTAWVDAIETAQDAEAAMTPRRPSLVGGGVTSPSGISFGDAWDHGGGTSRALIVTSLECMVQLERERRVGPRRWYVCFLIHSKLAFILS